MSESKRYQRFYSDDMAGVRVKKASKSKTSVFGASNAKVARAKAARIKAARAKQRLAGKTVSRKDIVKTVSEGTGLPEKDVSCAVKEVLVQIESALREGKEVKLVGFGTFSVSSEPGPKRIGGRAKKSAGTVEYTPTFKAGKHLKDAVSGQSQP